MIHTQLTLAAIGASLALAAGLALDPAPMAAARQKWETPRPTTPASRCSR